MTNIESIDLANVTGGDLIIVSPVSRSRYDFVRAAATSIAGRVITGLVAGGSVAAFLNKNSGRSQPSDK